ncbi:MAG: hypothetical protein WC823_06445 [Parcubacteria group bacterium]|jgi:hypothetical protein
MYRKNLLWMLLCLSFIFPFKAFAYPVSLPTAFPYVSNGTTFDKFVMFHNQSNIYYAIYAATTRDLPHVYTYNGYLRIIFNNSMQGSVLVYRHNGTAWASYDNIIYDGSPVGIAPGDNCAINPMFFTNTDLVFNSDDIPQAFLGYYKSSTVITASYCNIPQPIKGSVFYLANVPYQLYVNINPASGGTVTSNPPCPIWTCNNGLCMGSCSGTVSLTAYPSSGYAFDGWNYGNNTYSGETLSIIMNGDKSVGAFFMKTIVPQSSLKNQALTSERMNLYSFTLTEATSIAILSGGGLNLRARVLNYYGAAVLDQNYGEYSSGYTDIGLVGDDDGVQQVNFMYRKQNLEAGTYTLEVTPEDTQTPIDGSFSIIFLKKPADSDEFFAGMDALLDDDDVNNDYLDVYVKALYPDFYPNVDSLVSVDDDHIYDFAEINFDYNGVRAERQCKALTKFYLRTILGRGTSEDDGQVMESDPVIQHIQDGWSKFGDTDLNCIVDDDRVIKNGNASLIYHSLYLSNDVFGSGNCTNVDKKYFYNPDTEELPTRDDAGNLSSFVRKGDVFVQYISPVNNYNHYGLIYGYDETAENVLVLDSNVCSPGRICKAESNEGIRDTSHWKVSRPQ